MSIQLLDYLRCLVDYYLKYTFLTEHLLDFFKALGHVHDIKTQTLLNTVYVLGEIKSYDPLFNITELYIFSSSISGRTVTVGWYIGGTFVKFLVDDNGKFEFSLDNMFFTKSPMSLFIEHIKALRKDSLADESAQPPVTSF